MIKRLTTVTGALMLAVTFGAATPAVADKSGATGHTSGTQLAMSHGDHGGELILKRRAIFKCISTGLKNIKEGKGDAKANAALVLKNATILDQDLKALFPAGSHKGMTRAKEALWKDWDKFAKQAASLKEGAANLVKAEMAGDAKKGLKGVYKNCKACHKPFRDKKVEGAPKVKCG